MDIGVVINNQYKVFEHIGRGGMADVWSARDERLRRMVAIKTIAAGISEEFDPLRLFEKEAQTIAQMEHPHILPIYDFGEYDNNLYIVMRYVTGGSLEHVLSAGAMDVSDVMRMGEAIAQALDHAHENNIIHLDLKPPNILLDSSKTPYLADFGLATVIDRDGRAHNPGSGTLLYMAPEQLTSDLIDYRADIYAFAVMLYHMFTGRLPFDGVEPMAIRQLQYGDELPDIDNLPSAVTDILRLGTAQNPSSRPKTHAEIMQKLRDVLQPASISLRAGESFDLKDYDISTGSDDGGLAEATDIYNRARHLWQGGNGRFLLGVSHYILMAEYYKDAKDFGLSIDQWGYQMLLRGALEYDYDVKYWWKQMGNDDRRWVCLHALRSGNAPARIRAMEHLEHLPEAEGDIQIPRLVAQAIEIETDETAKLVALRLFGTRAKTMRYYRVQMDKAKVQQKLDTGRLATTLGVLGIQLTEPSVWLPVVYSREIDTLVADTVFDDNPKVAEAAARTIGRMHSLLGVEYIAKEQVEGRPGALDALALIRDETPGLPDVVSPQARIYAWITNTIRRLTENPMQSVMRFALLLLVAWLAMGDLVYSLFRDAALLSPQRWANAIAVGLVFSLFISMTFFVTDEMSRRLGGFWPWWGRLFVFGFVGFWMGLLSYAGFTWLFYQYTPIWDLMRFAGALLALAFILSSVLELRSWSALLFSTAFIYLPIYYGNRAFYLSQETTIAHVSLIALLLGGVVGWRAAQLSPISPRFKLVAHGLIKGFLSAFLALVWLTVLWFYYLQTLKSIEAGTALNWDMVLIMFVLSLIFGALTSYWLSPKRTFVFLSTALVGYTIVYTLLSWQFFDLTYPVPVPAGQPEFSMVYYDGTLLKPPSPQPVFHTDEDANRLFKIILPMVFVITLGANLQSLLASWWGWIGMERHPRERGGWMAFMLLYTLLLAGVASILTLFSMKSDVLWALGWSAWAFAVFVCALAAYRWAKWGADGLIVLGVLFLIGGIAFDVINSQWASSQGLLAPLMQNFTVTFFDFSFSIRIFLIWILWAVGTVVFVAGALKNALWSPMGLFALLVAWYFVAIFTPIQGSMAIFALVNTALIFVALKPDYVHMEKDRFHLPKFNFLQKIEAVMDEMEEDTSPPAPSDTQVIPVLGAVNLESMSTALGIRDTLAAKLETRPDLENMSTSLGIRDAMASKLDTRPDLDNMATSLGVRDELAAKMETRPELDNMATSLGVRDELSAKMDTKLAKDHFEQADKAQTPKISLNTGKVRSQDTGAKEASSEDSSLKPKINLGTSNVRSKNTIHLGAKPETPAPTEAEENKPKINLTSSKVRPSIKLGDVQQDSESKDTEEKKPLMPKIKLNTGKVGSQHTIHLSDVMKSSEEAKDEDTTPPTPPKDESSSE